MTAVATNRAPNQALAAVEIAHERKELTALGFALTPQYYALGANAGDWTAQGYKTKQVAHEAKPLARPGLEAFRDRVRAEKREDLLLRVSEIRADVEERAGQPAKTVLVTPDGDVRVEGEGFRALAARLPGEGTPRFLASVDPYLRAHAWNHLAPLVTEKDEVMLRTRLEVGGARAVYAVTSPSYHPYNPDRVAEDVLKHLDEQGLEAARVETHYDGDRVEIRLVWHNYHGTETAGSGDVFQFGVKISTGCSGKEALRVALVAYSNLCLNYLCIGEDVLEIIKRRHTGGENMRHSLNYGIASALEHGGDVLRRWEEVGREDLFRTLDLDKPEQVFAALLERGYGKVAGYDDEQLVRRYLKAMQFAPGRTRADFVNALTRAAHTCRWTNPWARAEIEESAGQLVYVRTLN